MLQEINKVGCVQLNSFASKFDPQLLQKDLIMRGCCLLFLFCLLWFKEYVLRNFLFVIKLTIQIILLSNIVLIQSLTPILNLIYHINMNTYCSNVVHIKAPSTKSPLLLQWETIISDQRPINMWCTESSVESGGTQDSYTQYAVQVLLEMRRLLTSVIIW